MARYKKYGVSSFRDKARPRRKPKLTKEVKKKLLGAALRSPKLFGFLKNNKKLRVR